MRGASVGKMLRWVWPGLAPALILVVVLVPLTFVSNSLERVATTMLINVAAVVGMYVFLGNSGVFSLGHLSFMGVGGYAAAILGMTAKTKGMLLPHMPQVLQSIHLPLYVAILAGGLVAAAFALLISQPILRLKNLALPIGTFALLLIVHQVLAAWRSMTGGTNTLASIPLKTTFWVALIWVVVAIAVALVFQNTALGLRLRASREDEVAARAAGISVLRERTWGLVVSAFVMGVAGGLVAFQMGFLYPDEFWLGATLSFIVMLICGGMRSLGGAVIGALAISVLSEVLRRLEGGFSLGFVHVPGKPGVKELLFAAVLLVVLIKRPAGIMGGREFSFPSIRRRRGAKPALATGNLSSKGGAEAKVVE